MTNNLTNLTNWDSWKWWLGCLVGAFLGTGVLVYLRCSSTAGLSGELPFTKIVAGALTISITQVVCLLAAFLVWKFVFASKDNSDKRTLA